MWSVAYMDSGCLYEQWLPMWTVAYVVSSLCGQMLIWTVAAYVDSGCLRGQ